MFWLLLFLFTVVPAVEIGLFIRIGSVIGVPATLAVVLFTGVAGAALARAQGLRVLSEVQGALSRGQMPTDELIEGGLVLVGGALLLTPGFMTDIFGICTLLPPTRKLMAAGVKSWAKGRIQQVGPGQAEVRGFKVWTGSVQPGPARKNARFDLGDEEPAHEDGPRTIDAAFTVVDGDGSADES